MARLKDEMYFPNPEIQKVYGQLYAEYEILHASFGRGENTVMKRLKSIKANAKKRFSR